MIGVLEGPRLKEMCVQITNECPLRCSHCSARSGARASDELTADEIHQLIDDFVELGGETLEVSGGEPIIVPHLGDVVGHASRRGLEVRLYSSGISALSAREATAPSASLWTRLKGLGLSKVFFNLQGGSSETHEQITRIPGSFRGVLASILSAKAAGLYVGIHFVPMIPNREQLPVIVGIARRHAVDEVAVLRFVSQGRGRDHSADLMLNSEELTRFIEEAGQLQNLPGGPRLRLGCPFNSRFLKTGAEPDRLCQAGTSVCHVTASGNVLPCSGFQQRMIVLGNIRNASLMLLWQRSSTWSRYRELYARGPHPSSLEFVRRYGEACLVQIGTTGPERPSAVAVKTTMVTPPSGSEIPQSTG